MAADKQGEEKLSWAITSAHFNRVNNSKLGHSILATLKIKPHALSPPPESQHAGCTSTN